MYFFGKTICQLLILKFLSVRILAITRPKGSDTTMIRALHSHRPPSEKLPSEIKYIPLYIYIPGTMITIEGTVIVILGNPTKRLTEDAL